MPLPPRPAAPRWKRITLWSALALLVLAVTGVFAARAAIDAYLRSERFRAFLAQKAGHTLHAGSEIAPLHFDTVSLYTDRFTARGNAVAAFSELRIEGIRAELSWRRFFEKVWQVDKVEIQRAQVQLDGPRIELTESAPPLEPRAAKSRGSGWLPNRVELATANIRELNLLWKDGGLRETAWLIQPGDGGWKLDGAGGKITHGTLPPLDVQRLELRYREPSLFVESAEFRQGANGSVVANGEVNLRERLDLHASIKNVALTPWLVGDWRLRLRGDASGEIDIRSPLPLRGPPEIRGTLTIANGLLETLPVLDKIAAFTRTQQFRRIALSRASGDFVQSGARLTVTNLVIESDRLIRIEGSFAIVNAAADRRHVPGRRHAIEPNGSPGSQSRVFTRLRGALRLGAHAPHRPGRNTEGRPLASGSPLRLPAPSSNKRPRP